MTGRVIYRPVDIAVEVETGTTLLDGALDAGIPLAHECGGNCACTTCRVVVIEGAERLSNVEAPEDDRLATAADRVPTMRLACQALLRGGPVVVWVVESLER
jgi:2Fe-2S ferredoxin